MKLQDFIIPLLCLYLTVWAWSYFWGPKQDADMTMIRSGQELKVMNNVRMCYPAVVDVEFNKQHGSIPLIKTGVQGYLSDATFISKAGVVEEFDFKRSLNGVQHTIATLVPPHESECERGIFLLALSQITPYNFELVKNENTESNHALVYRSVTDECVITKEFIVHKDKYQIDLVLTIDPFKKQPIFPRLFVPGPFMQEIAEHEKIAALVFTERGSFKKVSFDQVMDIAWAMPKMFGIEDRYFAYVLTSDNDHFTQRAYFKRTEGNRLTAIFEGPEVTEKTTWKLSFYCGPKELKELVRVDQRLDELMDYGWLAPISKVLLSFLNTIYHYVGNYGWAIVIITLLMRLLMLPFVRRSQHGMKKSNEYTQKLKHLEHKYKDNPEALRAAQFELTRKYGMGVFPLSGCMPLFIQFPIFIGLNFALRNAIELYKAPFIFWIQDLSAPDPYYILPACMTISIFFIISSMSKDPRYKIFSLVFSLITVSATTYLSAGLALFICVSSAIGILEKYVLPIKNFK